MLPTDYAPNLLLPQSDPVKNNDNNTFYLLPSDSIIHTSIEAQWEVWL